MNVESEVKAILKDKEIRPGTVAILSWDIDCNGVIGIYTSEAELAKILAYLIDSEFEDYDEDDPHWDAPRDSMTVSILPLDKLYDEPLQFPTEYEHPGTL